MGKAEFRTGQIPVISDSDTVLNKPVSIGGQDFSISCVSVGNPHCVVFTDVLDALNIEEIGPKFEFSDMFPERINTEFVRVIDKTTLRIRVWERGNGETLACGTGALCAVR